MLISEGGGNDAIPFACHRVVCAATSSWAIDRLVQALRSEVLRWSVAHFKAAQLVVNWRSFPLCSYLVERDSF